MTRTTQVLAAALCLFLLALTASSAHAGDRDKKEKKEKRIELRVEVDDDGKVNVLATEDGKEVDLADLKHSVKAIVQELDGEIDIEAIVDGMDIDIDDVVGAKKIFLKKLGEGDGAQIHKIIKGLPLHGEIDVEAIVVGGDDEDGERKIVIRKLKDHMDKSGNKMLFMGKPGDDHGQVMEWVGEGDVKVIRLGDGDGGERNVWVQKMRPSGKYLLGVALEPVSDALRSHLNLEGDVGMMVSSVFDGTPAEEAGIQRFDILVKVGGNEIVGHGDLVEAIEEAGAAGEELRLALVRGGDKIKVKVRPVKNEEDARFGDDDDDDDDGDDDDDSDGISKRERVRREVREARPPRRERDDDGESVDDLKKQIQELKSAVEQLKKSLDDD